MNRIASTKSNYGNSAIRLVARSQSAEVCVGFGSWTGHLHAGSEKTRILLCTNSRTWPLYGQGNQVQFVKCTVCKKGLDYTFAAWHLGLCTLRCGRCECYRSGFQACSRPKKARRKREMRLNSVFHCWGNWTTVKLNLQHKSRQVVQPKPVFAYFSGGAWELGNRVAIFANLALYGQRRCRTILQNLFSFLQEHQTSPTFDLMLWFCHICLILSAVNHVNLSDALIQVPQDFAK